MQAHSKSSEAQKENSSAAAARPKKNMARKNLAPTSPVSYQSMADNSLQIQQQQAIQSMANNNFPIQRIIHIGNEPDVPGNYRAVTNSAGSTQHHYGGGPMNIHQGIYTNNLQNAGAANLPAPQVGGKSDHSNVSLLDRTWASDNTPEIDHIVPVVNYGSNSYSNARVLSKHENNNNAAARPAGGNISTVTHKSIRIRDNAGYDNTTGVRGVLNANDHLRITAFGGLGVAIAANSGDVKNNVQIDEL
jgi:hypothetical protein